MWRMWRISGAVTATTHKVESTTGRGGNPANRDYFLNKAFEWSYKDGSMKTALRTLRIFQVTKNIHVKIRNNQI